MDHRYVNINQAATSKSMKSNSDKAVEGVDFV